MIDKVWSLPNLQSSWGKVHRNQGSAGVDRQSIEAFDAHSGVYLREIAEALKEGRHEPQPVRRQWIPKPGTDKKRPLGIPTVKDRIVQGALRHVLEPLWEARFLEQSYGFRPGRSCHDALRRVERLLRSGFGVVIDADIQSYFDEIDQDLLMKAIEEVVSDGGVLDLLRSYLRQPVMEELKEWTPTKGTPQGAVISPLLANIYLHKVDQKMAACGFEMIRYADDLVILCRTSEDANRAFELLKTEMTELRLKLHPEKTKIVDMKEKDAGFDFLGYRFETGRGQRLLKKVRAKSLKSIKDRIRQKTPPHSGTSPGSMAQNLNKTLKGWFNYFRHCTKFVFVDLDGFIRRRLRSVLRRQHKMYGTSHGYGADHQRWPNAYFTEEIQLFSLTAAWETFAKSRCGKH